MKSGQFIRLNEKPTYKLEPYYITGLIIYERKVDNETSWFMLITSTNTRHPVNKHIRLTKLNTTGWTTTVLYDP